MELLSREKGKGWMLGLAGQGVRLRGRPQVALLVTDSIRVGLKLVFITFSMVTSSDVVENSLPQSTSPALRQKKDAQIF